ncbi:MAG TPA: Ig-like domain-containing protein, partial [Verrucomicrobiae bacterium]|nr:Ig-like domain-containing protein [Verrucomicrobiae bacterium]
EPRHAEFQRYNGDDGYGPMREGRSVWWTWTAPIDGWVRVDPDTSSYDPIIAVYTGDSVRRLKLVSVNLDPMWVSYGGAAEFPARAGTTYQIVVDGRPSGDGRRPVPSEGRIAFSLDVTTLSLAQPVDGTIFIGPTDLNLRLQVRDTMVDGQLSSALFYTRMIDRPLIPLAVAGPSLEAVRPDVLPGYYLLYARATNNQGAVRVSAPTAIAVRPVNDEFNNAVRLEGYYVTNNGYIGASTWEKGEPKIAGSPNGSGTVWWSWLAPASGTAKVVIYGADVISAWTGESVRALKRVAPPNLSELTFKAKAGVRYRFSAARFGQTFFNSAGEATSLMLELKNVELTAPGQGLVVNEGAAVPLAIRTSEPLVNIARVEYLAGTEIIQTSTQPPFSVTWSNATAGSHAIQAVVVKTTGEQLPSNTAGISVRPANDSFANAFVLTGSNVVARGITSTATVETGEPPVPYFGTVWWRWTAPVSGRVIVKNTGSGPFFDLEAYVGTTLSNLVSVSDPPGAIEFQGHLTFRAEEGQTYFLAAEGNGQVQFELKLVEPPANDSFAGRRVTTGLGPIFIVDTFAATSEPGEPAHGDLVQSHSVWFEWTAPQKGTVRLINSGHNYGMAIAVYVGSSLSNLVPVAVIPTSKQDVWFNVSAGQAYAIAVGDRREGVRNIALSINYEAPPGNDNFAEATVLLPGSSLYSFNGPIVAATRESGEPSHGGAAEGTSVWWSWTPVRSGLVEIVVVSSYFVPRLAIYSGAELSSLVALGVGTNRVQLPVVAGTAYHLAIESANGQTGYYSCELVYLSFDAIQPAAAPDTNPVTLQIRNQQVPGVTGASVHILLDGPSGRRVAVESSENLLDWKVEKELVVSGEVELPVTPGQLFFRARVLP